MGKKKKKKKSSSDSSDEPKKKKKKKKKLGRTLAKLLIAGAAATAGYVLYNPEVIKDEEQKAQVKNAREAVLSLNETGQEKIVESLDDFSKLSSIKDHISTGVVLGEQEIYVEDAIREVTSALDDLPISQYHEFKANFCADLIHDATSSGQTN